MVVPRPRPLSLLRHSSVLFLVMSLAACSADVVPQAAPMSENAQSVATSSPTTRVTASTPTTAASLTTVPSSAKPILELATEWPTELDEIFGRYLLYWDALYIAFGPPVADADYAPLRELVSAAFHEDLTEQGDAFRALDQYVVLPEETITEHQVRLPNPVPLDKTEGSEVIIQDCWVDDSEIRSGEEGGLDLAYRESILRNVKMKVVDSEWRVWASTNASEDSSGYDQCTDLINQL